MRTGPATAVAKRSSDTKATDAKKADDTKPAKNAETKVEPAPKDGAQTKPK